MNMKNKYKHNDDGTTHIFIESKSMSYLIMCPRANVVNNKKGMSDE